MKTTVVTGPYSETEGPTIPIEINGMRNGSDRVRMGRTRGLLATGSPLCYMNRRFARRFNIIHTAQEPWYGVISMGLFERDTIFWIPETMPYSDHHDVVLGLSFLNGYEIVFDGPGKVVSLLVLV